MLVMNNRFYNIAIISGSKKGINRIKNQDDVLILNNDQFHLFVLFDGVSSYLDSIGYIKTCKSYLKDNFEKYIKGESGLQNLFYSMHKHMCNLEFDGKSTCSSLLIYKYNTNGYLLNVGDSRIYAFSDSFLESITLDDNLPGNKNILTKYLGKDELKFEDFAQVPINVESNYLLCSDGFYSLMEMNLKKYF